MSAPMRRGRRILVALDGGPDSMSRLEQAAMLAADLQVELAGLFVEDDDLFRLCGLPVREISLGSGAVRRPDRATMERELRVRQAEARRRLQDVAVRRRVSWSFEVRRGRGREALLGAAAETDVVAMWRSVLTVSRRSGRATAPPPVVALFEGGERARHVLDVAARTARQHGAPLLVLTTSKQEDDAKAALSAAGIVAGLRLMRSGKATLLRSLKVLQPHLLVLDAGGAAASKGLLDGMLTAADCDGLLIGGG